MIRVLQGDVRERLAELADDSFDCIVTSPPYWGLRDYGVAGQIGLESTLTEYLDTMIAVCRELRRVLKPSGVFFLNIGDCYTPVNRGENAKPRRDTMTGIQVGNPHSDMVTRKEVIESLRGIFKSKDLMMIPNRLAILLQADGWWVRSEIIWYKPNPMPESVTDRPTSSHEKIWMLTKGANYWYDADAISEQAEARIQQRLTAPQEHPKARLFGGSNFVDGGLGGFRNARNVWKIASQSYSEAHFATFPPDLAERCIKAGCPAGGHVLDPFGGAGTTAMVADRLRRDCTLIELNADYVGLIRSRIEKDAGMFAQIGMQTSMAVK